VALYAGAVAETLPARPPLGVDRQGNRVFKLLGHREPSFLRIATRGHPAAPACRSARTAARRPDGGSLPRRGRRCARRNGTPPPPLGPSSPARTPAIGGRPGSHARSAAA